MKLLIPLVALLAAVAAVARSRKESDPRGAFVRSQLNKPRRSYAQ